MNITESPRGVIRNDRAQGRVTAGDAAAVVRFHRSLPGYEPTPLIDAAGLARRLGVASVHVKDESNRLSMPSFKILGASWATYRALLQRLGYANEAVGGLTELRSLVGGSGLTLVAATDGNHGRAVARMARLLDLGAGILVPRDMVPARISGIEEEGATVTVVDGNYDVAVRQAAQLADATHLVISDTSWPGYETVPRWVIDGYATIAEEVSEQLAQDGKHHPTVVAAQMGVGAFAAAMVRGFLPTGARIVGVEPTKAACILESIRAGEPVQLGGALDSIMAGLNCGTPSPVAWPTLVAGIGSFAAVCDADAEEAMRALADGGVMSGESGAAGLAALLAFRDDLGLGPDDHILVVSTEGATDPDAYRRIVADTPR